MSEKWFLDRGCYTPEKARLLASLAEAYSRELGVPEDELLCLLIDREYRDFCTDDDIRDRIHNHDIEVWEALYLDAKRVNWDQFVRLERNGNVFHYYADEIEMNEELLEEIDRIPPGIEEVIWIAKGKGGRVFFS